jgi:hypothetical protein
VGIVNEVIIKSPAAAWLDDFSSVFSIQNQQNGSQEIYPGRFPHGFLFASRPIDTGC